MCGTCYNYQAAPSDAVIAVASAILPYLAYDISIGGFNFYRWAKSKRVHSFMALGLAATIFCGIGGLVYGSLQVPAVGPVDFRSVRESSSLLQIYLAILFSYPAIDFLFARRKRFLSYFLKLPIALCAMWICFLANSKAATLPYWLFSGLLRLDNLWIYNIEYWKSVLSQG